MASLDLGGVDLGTLFPVSAAFQRFNKTTGKYENKDPDRVTVEYGPRNGPVTTLVYGTDSALIKDGEGVYHVDINCDTATEWNIRFFGDGIGQAPGNAHWVVAASPFDH